MLEYNEIIPKKYILLDGEPYEVIASHVFRKQQRKPVNQTKLRHMKTGKVIERSFGQAEKAPEADIQKKTITYLYRNRGEVFFCEAGNPKERFSLPEDIVGTAGAYLKEKTDVDALVLGEDAEIIGITVPVKMDLQVAEAAAAVKGNTAQGATKQVVLETGATITVPLFINEGDIIRINTETGAYTERVSKG